MSDGWQEFYFLVGSSAGALIGLLFVVITLTANYDPSRAETGARVYVTPTVVHFASVLFVSAVALVPGLPANILGIFVLIPSAGGLFYVAVVIKRFFGRLPDEPHWSDPIFYAALPAVGYTTLAVAGVSFITGHAIAPDALALGVLGLLFTGIRDAWDVALWVSTHPDEGKRRD
jgi:hypothetical protein